MAIAVMNSACAAGIYHAIAPEGDENNLKARYEENIALFEPRFENNALTNTNLMYLCEAYSKTKRFTRLSSCLDRMEERYNMGEKTYFNFDLYDFVVLGRTKAKIDLGDYAGAAAYSQAYLDQKKSDLSRYAQVQLLSFNGLAKALTGDATGARAVVEQMESIYLGYPFNLLQQDRDEGEARIYMALNDYAKAYEVMQRVSGFSVFTIAVAETAFGSTGWFVFRELPNKFMKAKAAYAIGRTEEARKSYDELLANERTRANGEILWQLLYDRGRMAEAEGKGEVALRFYLQSIEVVEQQRKSISSETSKIGFVGNKQALYTAVVDLLVRQGQFGKAFEYVERAKSRALVDLLAERQNIVPQNQANTAATLQQLASLEQRYRILSPGVEEHRRLRSAMTDAAGDLRQKAPELASLVTVEAPAAADIQARLGTDETLLEFYGQGDDLFVFTVTRDSTTAAKLNAKGLEDEVRAFRDSLRDVRADARAETWKPLSRQLYDRLIAPVANALAKPRLIIVSHGALHYLPWGALFDGQQFLVDRVTLHQLPSASVMQFLAARKPATAKDMLLLGNPDLGRPDMDLPGAEAEVRAIKGIWPNSTMLMRKSATKGTLQKAGQLFKVIHVAAHGEFLSDQPLSSRLLLAPEGADNGQLTAGDLYGMHLNADLVTLSACETGMGKVLSGDDVVGLTRGFLYAGSNSIVASLWPVSDDETKFLMTSFYTNLKRMPKANALRQAQLETKKKYPHPFFWSAFQLTGMGR
ncbi:MAG: hypothetical protein A2051_06575 [Desulfovibrionales bacterium GWA2_65_9]|nr:MAG: hypothetical protein A2051_06575 [Desulfovibrionales bacterium GWA2_65_9]